MKSLIYIIAFIFTFANCFAEESDNCKIQGFERPAWNKADSGTNVSERYNPVNPTVLLHPNPTGGAFIITSKSTEFVAGSISITDLLGQIVIEDVKFEVINSESIEVRDERFTKAPRGIYFLRIFSENETIQLKLVKFE
ncbi:MAG: T9SS type A sorting domain-containing protein [Candidatus Kapabacteria bacterium]|nr:T9SS type A sorting domain-containing protein [Candidatus Kapabacteria bacterium]